MINRNEFRRIREELKAYDVERESLIKKARDVLKLSKQVIYSIHRGNLDETEKLVKEAKKEKEALDKIASKFKGLDYEGSYSEAMQEYSEALTYYGFVTKKKIPSIKELNVSPEDYLMGVCDLTGELMRRAVSLTVKKRFREVEEIKKLVEDIHDEFLKFDLRNGHLRKKSDSIKYNLHKIEDIVYDTHIKGKK